ncbi:MAG TPA: acyl-CoA dehydrogenase family protein [Candidatus Cybelea sp.]|nr:acyl-CoA dehydrogenase family protein [Candidatus Cybelea sp.]
MANAERELSGFRKDVVAWLTANTPKADFLLPQTFMEVGDKRQFDFLRDWQRKVYEAGYLGMAWPAEYGGRGMPQAFQDVVTQEMVRLRTPFMMNTIGLQWAGPLILHFGSHEVKDRYIKRILSAEDVWCQGFSEPDHGSDLASAQTFAERSGNGYVVNGSKIWTTLGPYADYMILLARTDRAAESKYAGLSFFLCPMKHEGISVRPIRKLTGEFGFSQVFFTDARIPATCLLGEEGQGWHFAMQTLTFERGAKGGQAGGPSSTNFAQADDLIALARRMKKNGAPAMDDPLVRDQLMRLIIDDTALQLNPRRQRVAALVAERPLAIPLMNKLVGSEHRLAVGRFTASLLGPEAALYVGDPDAVDGGKWLRGYFNAFSSTIGGGTSEVQRNILGERVLGLPKS